VRVLVDTSTFIWIISRPARLSREALRVLKKPNTVRELSTLSLTEIAIKVLDRKLDLTKEQIRQKIEAAQVQVLPYQAAHAYAFYDLPLHHYDPFDRQIIAQAIAENIPIVTGDEAFEKYPVKVIW
jgi:PIN domain nuclease of toxin-antitoxin system